MISVKTTFPQTTLHPLLPSPPKSALRDVLFWMLHTVPERARVNYGTSEPFATRVRIRGSPSAHNQLHPSNGEREHVVAL